MLTPPPFRDEENQPARVVLVGAALAEVWGVGRRRGGAINDGGGRADLRWLTAPRDGPRSLACFAATGSTPAKRLGQNFLVDPNIIRKIVDLAGVGPGRPGARGRGRYRHAHPGAGRHRRQRARLRDRRTIAAGARRGPRRFDNVEVRYADAAEAQLADGPWTVVANLPYYLSTTLLLDWLQTGSATRSASS